MVLLPKEEATTSEKEAAAAAGSVVLGRGGNGASGAASGAEDESGFSKFDVSQCGSTSASASPPTAGGACTTSQGVRGTCHLLHPGFQYQCCQSKTPGAPCDASRDMGKCRCENGLATCIMFVSTGMPCYMPRGAKHPIHTPSAVGRCHHEGMCELPGSASGASGASGATGDALVDGVKGEGEGFRLKIGGGLSELLTAALKPSRDPWGQLAGMTAEGQSGGSEAGSEAVGMPGTGGEVSSAQPLLPSAGALGRGGMDTLVLGAAGTL